jgi:hypothetical protein
MNFPKGENMATLKELAHRRQRRRAHERSIAYLRHFEREDETAAEEDAELAPVIAGEAVCEGRQVRR